MATVSMAGAGAEDVVVMLAVGAAAAAAAFFSPANLQTTVTPLATTPGAEMLSTRLVVDNEATAEVMPVPVQTKGVVG